MKSMPPSSILQRIDATSLPLQMAALPQWSLDQSLGTITREFVFNNFSDAFAFMSQIALAADKHNHHPEWRNVYNKVTVTWTTHDVGGLSLQDFAMANLCEQLFFKYSR